ncbi:MAG: hypothetical protein PWQ77_1662 [Kosmotogales bacterium]|nr:hypothetical protein [Kosmotogales bacterium]
MLEEISIYDVFNKYENSNELYSINDKYEKILEDSEIIRKYKFGKCFNSKKIYLQCGFKFKELYLILILCENMARGKIEPKFIKESDNNKYKKNRELKELIKAFPEARRFVNKNHMYRRSIL